MFFDFSFYFPWAIVFLFLLLPILGGQIALWRYRQAKISTYTSPTLFPFLLSPRSFSLTWMKNIGWLLIWIFTCIALMGPFGNRRYPSLQAASQDTLSPSLPHEVIFLVDISASMGVADAKDGKTRLEEAKELMQLILHSFQGQMVSLYAFTSILTPLVPATLDYLFVRLAVHDLHLDEGDIGGTQFRPVLHALEQDAFAMPSLKHYTVILLSDGGDTQLEPLKGEARKKEVKEILNAMSDPKKLHLHLHTIGIGSLQAHPIPHVTFDGKPVFSQLEPDILKQLATHYRGTYYQASQESSYQLAEQIVKEVKQEQVMDSADVQLERQVVTAKQEEMLTDLYYQFPLGLALLGYLFNLFHPKIRRL